MRIEGPRSTDSVKKSEKTKKSSSTGGVFSSFLTDETEETGAAAPMSSPMGIGSILAAQYEDPAEKQARQRMQERAYKVLDSLDVIQRGLVTGGISENDMKAVQTSVSANREKINDPRLLAIMDEVDLRAQVELAKLEAARDKKR
ncbi:MAG TPA: flagellar assembly protein FliX [Alphaproteobacteria bacterium]